MFRICKNYLGEIKMKILILIIMLPKKNILIIIPWKVTPWGPRYPPLKGNDWVVWGHFPRCYLRKRLDTKPCRLSRVIGISSVHVSRNNWTSSSHLILCVTDSPTSSAIKKGLSLLNSSSIISYRSLQTTRNPLQSLSRYRRLLFLSCLNFVLDFLRFMIDQLDLWKLCVRFACVVTVMYSWNLKESDDFLTY